jgi:drug/metabolite transporter (DMT)-like permease
VPLWSLLALGAAACTTAADLQLRSLLRHGLTARLAMGASCCITTLLAVPLILLLRPAIQPGALLTALAATALINGVAFWSYGRALARGELSLVLPLINLSPLVLLLSGWLVLGERPSGLVVAGVALLVGGAILLGRSDALSRGLLRAPGARAMLLTAVLWGIGASIDKLGVQAGGSLLWVAGLNLVVGTPLLLGALAAGDPHQLIASPEGPARELFAGPEGRRRLQQLLAVGLLALVGTALQMEALRFTAVVHVVAIKRLSTLFGSAIGVLWLGEYSGSLRLPAAALMSGGAVLVLLAARS